MADPRDFKGRWPPPRPPGVEGDEVVSSEDTTVLPGVMDADDDTDAVFRRPLVGSDASGPVATGGGLHGSQGEDVEVFVSSLARAHTSGAYASLVSLSERAAPAPAAPLEDEPPAALFAPLPEMSADIWQAGLRALVGVPETVDPPWLDDAYWRDLGGLFIDELAHVEEPARRLELTLSAARVADRLGDGDMALRLVDDGLALAPDAPEAWRARARLLEQAGDIPGAHEAWRQLGARVTDAEEREVYEALDGEWTLARGAALEGGAAPSLESIPDGPARALAEAELALLRGTPAEVASALEQAAFGTGDAVGAALLEAAARFHEVGGDAAAAAEQRFVAARMDAGGAGPPLGRLRDAARLGPDEIEAALAELRAELGPSALGDAVARWAEARARARGNGAAAREILAGAAGPTPSSALLRDRLDLDLELGVALDEDALTLLRERAPSSAAAAMLALLEATALARRRAIPAALARLREALERLPDALPLGLYAEELARASDDPATRIPALELWLGVDPARRASAALALADAIDARGDTGVDAGADLASRAALQTAIEAASGAAVFWTTAARDARAGRVADAAATLAFGAELWAGSRLGAPLAERAAELAALTAADAAVDELHALASAGPAELERLLTIARGVARAGSSADRYAWLTDQVGVLTDVQTRAWWWIRRAQALAPGAGHERVACLEAALDKVPGHPVALALLLGDPTAPPARAPVALAAAGTATDHVALRVAAVHLAALSGEADAARDLAAELAAAHPGSAAALELAVDLARAAGGAPAAAAIVARLAADVGDDTQALRIAEALEVLGETARATEVLERVARGPLVADARRAAARLGAASPGAGLPLELFARPVDREADEAAQALARLGRAAEQGRGAEIVRALEKEPPHEAAGGADALYLAALFEEQTGGGRTAELCAAADAAGPGRLASVVRIAEAGTDARTIARASERAAALVGAGGGDPRAVATYLRRAAVAYERAGAAEDAARCVRAAVAADPEDLSAIMALRREAARRHDLAATVEACAMEARVLRGRPARMTALLRAAALARHDDTGTAPPPNRHVRALGLFRQALELEPGNETAFAGLRALLEENAAHGVLAETLASRIGVARNPFEITALRLARAELLAGPLDDRRGAEDELETILQKEPQHARALARLSDLAYEDGAFAEAGELYLRRAVLERAPEALHEVLVRLGRIYTRHVPDAKRAIGAYARVLQNDPRDQEALEVLSELYVETGDVKSALAITETLTTVERDEPRRLAALIRCGQLHERAGDLRQAGARFRAAADQAPRDIAAVGELARFLERTRDQVGRRALLDHAVGLLRHDVERGHVELSTLRALVPLLHARGKPRAAAAAAQLLAATSEDAAEREAARGWAAPPARGRRLAALERHELDERTFPPALLPGMRHIFRIAGAVLSKGAPELARHGVTRGDKVPRGQAARDIFDGVSTELGVPDVDVFVRAPAAGTGGTISTAGASAPTMSGVRVLPGDRPAVILAAELPALGGHALRFAAARALRLVSTHLDLLLAVPPADAGALLGGVIRQFVPDFKHPEVRDELLALEAERIAKILPRKLKPELMPFAVESAGAFDLAALHAAVRDGANAVGMLACGDLPAALAAVLAGSGRTLAPADLAQHGEARELLRFALSDDYDELAQAME
jgi:tetratricopeptide (TPR) repeat protein